MSRPRPLIERIRRDGERARAVLLDDARLTLERARAADAELARRGLFKRRANMTNRRDVIRAFGPDRPRVSPADLLDARHERVHVEGQGRPARAARPVPVALRILARALRGGGIVRCSDADAYDAWRVAAATSLGGPLPVEVDPELRPGEIEVLR